MSTIKKLATLKSALQSFAIASKKFRHFLIVLLNLIFFYFFDNFYQPLIPFTIPGVVSLVYRQLSFNFNSNPHITVVLTCSLRDENDFNKTVSNSLNSVLSQEYESFDSVLNIHIKNQNFRKDNELFLDLSNYLHHNSFDYVLMNETLSIEEERNNIFKYTKNELLKKNGFVLFLDNCESLTKRNALSLLVESWYLFTYKIKGSFQQNKQPIHYLIPNIGDLEHDKDTKLERTPYQILTNPKELSQPTSIFMKTEFFIEGVQSDLNRIFDSHDRIEIKNKLFNNLTFCNRKEVFWINLSMESYLGAVIPLPLLESNSYNFATNEVDEGKCEVDLAIDKIKVDNAIQFLINLKRNFMPLVSVIMPFFNVASELWFKEAVNSLTSQTFNDFEIIIVNDGSDPRFKSFKELKNLENALLDNKFLVTNGKSKNLIPLTIIHHNNNLGLSEARNTGALSAKGEYIIFFDPDDKLDHTALEKLTLFAIKNIDSTVPHRGGEKKIGFVYSGTIHFGSKDDIVYSEFTEKKLLTENFMTATTLISKEVYLNVGGMCERSILSYFEDYDFWLRVTTMGWDGLLLREPLFHYRRHSMGQSMKIMDQSKGKTTSDHLAELRRNNPVPFNDMSSREMFEILKNREENQYTEYDFKTDKKNNLLPCYKPMRSDLLKNTVKNKFVYWKTRFFDTTYVKKTTNSSLKKSSEMLLKNENFIFPLNPSFGYTQLIDGIQYNVKKKNILYVIPWMVMGGADLYDVTILEMLHEVAKFNIILLVERFILNQVWEHHFKKYSNEIFFLQTLTNDTHFSNEILDYLILKKNIDMVINRGTVVGYNAFERWGDVVETNEEVVGNYIENKENESFLFKEGFLLKPFFPKFIKDKSMIWHLMQELKKVDILHLYCLKDRSNWEWRSGRNSRVLDKRIVVSNDLKNYLVNTVKYGDSKLGILTTSEFKLDLIPEDVAKIKIIYPPLDLNFTLIKLILNDSVVEKLDDDNTIYWFNRTEENFLLEHVNTINANHKNTTDFEKNENRTILQKVNFPSKHDKYRRKTLIFIGRLDFQKDPVTFLKICLKYYEFFKIKEKKKQVPEHSQEEPRIMIIGDGNYRKEIQNLINTHKDFKEIKKNVEFFLDLSRPSIMNLLLKTVNSVLISTSKYEGLPIVGLESLGMGIPVVMLTCGGFKEVLTLKNVWAEHQRLKKYNFAIVENGVTTEDYSVHRGALSSILDYECEGPFFQENRPEWLINAFVEEISYWLDKSENHRDEILEKNLAPDLGRKLLELQSWLFEINTRRNRLILTEKFRMHFSKAIFKNRVNDLISEIFEMH
ncbi:hypothetical protein HDU92_007395 [Lobulomyces angularis]|nr:hypothetical protein HDU92_007395 [Lobulomyces angularis]